MTIIADTREQRVLSFKCEVVRKTLKFGDYGAMVGDYQIPVVFERKNLGDLYGSLTFGYDRLRKCFERAEKANFRLIIAIEGTKELVLEGYRHSSRDPESIIKQLETIHRKYGIEYQFFRNRPEMANFITEFFEYKEKEYLIT